MTTTPNYQEIARKNAERATRIQMLRAMEKLLIGLGSKHDYIVWLEAMPENAKIGASGGLENATIIQVAENEGYYTAALRAFAQRLGPVLTTMSMGGVE